MNNENTLTPPKDLWQCCNQRDSDMICNLKKLIWSIKIEITTVIASVEGRLTGKSKEGDF